MIIERAFFRFPNANHPIIDLDETALDWSGLATLSGPSGSGKTTLFRLMSSWYEEADAICSFAPALDRYRQVRFVGAHESLLPWRSAVSNLHYRGFSDELAVEELRQLGLSVGVDAPVTDLSYGMYKRVELAIAVNDNPDLLLLDEFFSSIDDETKVIIRQYLLQKRPNLRTWIIAHEESLRRWLTGINYALTVEKTSRTVVGIARASS
jgi:ABC-type nitrate/sulfonate/bicarbonate transport system ATPase subunit